MPKLVQNLHFNFALCCLAGRKIKQRIWLLSCNYVKLGIQEELNHICVKMFLTINPRKMVRDFLAFQVLCVSFIFRLASSQALQVAVAKRSLHREPGLGYAYFVRHTNSKLEEENPRQYHAPNYKPCAVACTKNITCLSFNFGKKPIFSQQGQTQYLCELLSTDKYNASSKYLSQSSDFDHYSIRSNCSKFPCLHNFTCVANYTEETYDCSCPRPPYKGKHCQDVDECSRGQHDCSPNATCTNTIGSYQCTCADGYIGNGKTCNKYKWLKMNTNPVCFGAQNSAYGSFYVNESGKVLTVKLVHLSGYVLCYRLQISRRSNWGCKAGGLIPDFLCTIVTNSTDQKILPQDEFISHWPGLGFQIPGFTSTSPELIYDNFTTPMDVTAGEEYRIWYCHDLTKFDYDNAGTSCADVYMYGLF